MVNRVIKKIKQDNPYEHKILSRVSNDKLPNIALRNAVYNYYDSFRIKNYTGSLFAEKDGNELVFYSYGYHFPIAKVDLRNNVAYFNTEKYSPTTSHHQSLVKRELIEYGFKIIPTEL